MKLALADALTRHNADHPDAPLTQADVARELGTTEAVVSKHMRGRVAPGARKLEKYAAVLKCGVGDLFREDGS